jgi:aerobic-type carbon monoxide dehydrogenase small subunit (CoxS/CutS family)
MSAFTAKMQGAKANEASLLIQRCREISQVDQKPAADRASSRRLITRFEALLMTGPVDFWVNDKAVNLNTPLDRRLLWVLRTDLGLTGAKYGCGVGMCGACTVLLDGVAVRSCTVMIRDLAGKRVVTIEGLAQGGKLHPLQQTFVDHGAMQCGYCTPGMILNAYGLLLAHPNPTEADVISGMDDNLCRCGAQPRIVKAILEAAQVMKGGA